MLRVRRMMHKAQAVGGERLHLDVSRGGGQEINTPKPLTTLSGRK